jgi:hypothetical protein
VKNIGKPCAGKPHARFDEGGLVKATTARLFRHRRTKGAETDKPNLKPRRSALYSTLLFLQAQANLKEQVTDPTSHTPVTERLPKKGCPAIC